MTDLITPWEVVERAKAGDRDAVAEIYRNCQPGLFRFVAYRVKDTTVAEDITSALWVRALSGLNNVNWQGRDIQAWLTTIARNLIADYFKSAHTRLSVPDMLDTDRVDDCRFSDPSVELAHSADASHLDSALRRLTKLQRSVVSLRYLNELTVAETADVMGCDQGAVKSVSYRALRSLATDERLRKAVTP